jgi:hypothetical protein
VPAPRLQSNRICPLTPACPRIAGFFTLIAGRVAGVDTFTLAKVGAVLTSFLGVILVSLSDSSPDALSADAPARRYVLGDVLALLSAALYALYAVTLKVRVRSEARVDMQLFFGFVGAFNVLAAWPMGVLLHITRVEVFALPTTRRAVAGLLLNVRPLLASPRLACGALTVHMEQRWLSRSRATTSTRSRCSRHRRSSSPSA